MKQVRCLLGRKRVHVARHMDGLRERVVTLWCLSHFCGDISSRFPLASQYDLPGSEFVFDNSQDSPTCACTCPTKEEF